MPLPVAITQWLYIHLSSHYVIGDPLSLTGSTETLESIKCLSTVNALPLELSPMPKEFEGLFTCD
jgi:hypothetical protein